VQWRSQGVLQYCPSSLQDSLIGSLADQKPFTMSYEVLFIAKGGVTLDIPFCDSSSTLMTLHILYECYIQLLTLELPLDKMLHYNAHVLMWDKMAWASYERHQWHSIHWAETNSLTCLWGWRWWNDAKLGCLWWCAFTPWWHLAEVNSCLYCISMAPSSNSLANLCMVFLHVVELETHQFIVSMLIFKCVLVVMHINLSKYMFSSS